MPHDWGDSVMYLLHFIVLSICSHDSFVCTLLSMYQYGGYGGYGMGVSVFKLSATKKVWLTIVVRTMTLNTSGYFRFFPTFRVTEVDMEDTEAAMEADTAVAMEDMAMGELSLDHLHRVIVVVVIIVPHPNHTLM